MERGEATLLPTSPSPFKEREIKGGEVINNFPLSVLTKSLDYAMFNTNRNIIELAVKMSRQIFYAYYYYYYFSWRISAGEGLV